MPLNRRQFFGSSLPLLALNGTAIAAAAPPADRTVMLAGDGIPRTALESVAYLQQLVEKLPQPADAYLADGAVKLLEARFSALLGKEDTVFLPTGTLANHVALRLLCGDERHALVQQESHLYRDESNSVTTLSGINLVPLAPGRAAPTLAELRAAIDRAELGPYPIRVGAIALESPVRRADGATLPLALVEEIAALARLKNIPLHLDGARLLLMHGQPGFDVQRYAAPFDTVYVSLYKYLGAPYGGVLSGTKAAMAKARALRHQFGGTIYRGWQAALPALDALEGFAARMAAVQAAGEQLLAALARIDGIKVRRVEHGSNIAFLDLAPTRAAGLAERLKAAGIRTRSIENGTLELAFNATLLRRDIGEIVAAFR